MSHEFNRRRNISLEMAGKIVTTTMSRTMAFLAYQSLWFAKIRYPFPVTTFTRKQCREIAAPFLTMILPAIAPIGPYFPDLGLYGRRSIL